MSDTQFLLLQKVLVTFRLSYAEGMAEISEAYLLYFWSMSTLSLLILLTSTFLVLQGFFTCLHCCKHKIKIWYLKKDIYLCNPEREPGAVVQPG